MLYWSALSFDFDVEQKAFILKTVTLKVHLKH